MKKKTAPKSKPKKAAAKATIFPSQNETRLDRIEQAFTILTRPRTEEHRSTAQASVVELFARLAEMRALLA